MAPIPQVALAIRAILTRLGATNSR
jgi:hypothetical protein